MRFGATDGPRCPHCGAAPNRQQDVTGNFQAHIRKCAKASPEERAYFKRRGEWSAHPKKLT